MIIQQAFIQLISQLGAHYDDREARNIAEILFEDLLKIKRFQSLESLSEKQEEELEIATQALLAHKPIQYITGISHFYGYEFMVNRNVLIPRPETEELVFLALESLKKKNAKARVLDIGTGSGCIPISLKKQMPYLEVEALDISKDALSLAKANAERLQTKIVFHQLDFLNPIEWLRLGSYDYILSNPPYIPLAEKNLMEANVIDYEPHLALFVENNEPLIFYDKIASFAHQHLNANGYIFLEVNQYNALQVKQSYINSGFIEVELIKDMSGNDRIVKAKKGPGSIQ